MDLSRLNKNQKEAVETIYGPIMAIAGAGSGKTSVLTNRLAYMIEQGVDAFNILAVTFTNKAAKEMKERAKKLAGDDADIATICTFHSFCGKILRIEVEHTGYLRGFEIIDEDDSLEYVKDAIKALNLDANEYKPRVIRTIISREKNGTKFVTKDFNFKANFDKISKLYNELLKNDNVMDFDDMLLNTYNLFKNNKEVLYKYQNRYKYIMVDEFQDTNTIQYQLIKMLSIASQNIFIVGDEDQSIYSFRGAKIENIKLFQQDFPNYKTIILNQNYRSNQNILDAANSVIKNNENRIKKELYSEKKSKNLIVYKRLDSQYEEEQYIVKTIKELNKTIPYNEMAILYRANSLSRGIEESLVREGIPYKIFGGFSYFSRKEVKDIIAYLRLIVDDSSNVSVKRLANIPKRKVGKTTLEKLENIAKNNKMSMFEAIDISGNKGLMEFKETILDIRKKVFDEPLNKYIDIILNNSGYMSILNEESDEEKENRLDNIYEFNSIIEEAIEANPDSSNLELLELLLEDLALRTDKNDVGNTDSDVYVSVMTLHQSKGLEFEVVFLMAMEEEIFPSARAILEGNIEEERRLAYVGITRAKEHLYITNARTRRLYGQIQSFNQSRFVKEIDSNCIEKPKKILKENERVPKPSKVDTSRYKPIKEVDNSELKPGDKIIHKMFGEGVVISVGDNLAKIAFKAPYGIKELLKNHPAISKI